ncbi:abortive infection family protein [Sanguibacter sp. 25GB23B1]|uniref:abortive infection family protein n=1 Tax=unclassified Sanguibacter TaxID=2645534 RepID=UPI0032AEE647
MAEPVSADIGATFGQFFFRGDGPSHSTLTGVIHEGGYGDDDPFDPATKTPSKQQRVLTVFRSSLRHPSGAHKLVTAMLSALRVGDHFTPGSSVYSPELVSRLRRAFAMQGWDLSSDGHLARLGDIDLDTGGREALEEQLARIQRNVEDPAALLGAAKDLIESISKFVLEETHMLPERKMDFPEALHLAMDQLGMVPRAVDSSVPGGKAVRAVYQSAQTIALQVNELRNAQGTGHGRTLPTGVTAETARFVIREAAIIAELLLSSLDRQTRA